MPACRGCWGCSLPAAVRCRLCRPAEQVFSARVVLQNSPTSSHRRNTVVHHRNPLKRPRFSFLKEWFGCIAGREDGSGGCRSDGCAPLLEQRGDGPGAVLTSDLWGPLTSGGPEPVLSRGQAASVCPARSCGSGPSDELLGRMRQSQLQAASSAVYGCCFGGGLYSELVINIGKQLVLLNN